LSVPGVPFVHIGSDGGLLARPATLESLTVAPGERFDVVLDLSGQRPGTELTVENGLGRGGTASVLRLRVTRRASDDSRVPDRLSSVPRLDPVRAVRTRQWRFTRGEAGGHHGRAENISTMVLGRRADGG